MNDEIKKLVEQIVSAIPEELSEKQIENISNQCILLKQKPEITITSDPKEFDDNAREKRIISEDSWVGKDELSLTSSTLYGDYKPGIDELRENRRNGKHYTKENHQISDFSINQMQIALARDLKNDDFGKLIIYVPEKKEYSIISYREFLENEQRQSLCNQIEEAANGMLTMLEIKKIVSQYDFSKGMPKVHVTSDPKEFDGKSKEKIDEYVHHAVERTDLRTSTKTLYGDYTPGMHDIAEYYDSQLPPYIEETNSEFSLLKPQVTLVTNTNYREFSGKEVYEEETLIVIYLPKERNDDLVSYSQLTEEKHHISEVKSIVTEPRRRMGDIRAIMDLYNKKRANQRPEEQK